MAVTICAGAVLDATLFLFALKPKVLWQMISIVLFLAVLIVLITDLVVVPDQWKRYRFKSFLPFCVGSLCLAMSVPSVISGHLLRDHLFRCRLPQYEAVLRMMMDGSIEVREQLGRIELPSKYSNLALMTLAQKDDNDILTAEFIIGGGFPVKHSGYLYRSDGELQKWEHAARWPRWFKIDDHWYRISD